MTSPAEQSGAFVEASPTVIPVERIASRIYLIRGEKVMLDSDLAELYGVTTKVLNQAVRRNAERFPEDFMFQLSSAEFEALLTSQFVTSKPRGKRELGFHTAIPELRPSRSGRKSPHRKHRKRNAETN